jgi:energy-coupling factor transport system permease protein
MPVGYSIYLERPSYIHRRLDPRTKLVCLLTIFVLALTFNHPLVLGVLFAAVLAAGIAAQVPIGKFAPFVVAALWFLVLDLLLWPIYIQQGPLIGQLGPVRWTTIGLLFGLAMGLRVALMVTSAGVWMMTTSPQIMTLGLLRMGMPYKAGMAMSAAIRFVPLINAERMTITEAQRARGLELKRGDPLRRALRWVAVIGPMLVRSLDIAQSLAIAMDARAFGARPNRTSILSIQLSRVDRAVMIACALLAAGGLVCRLLGIGLVVRSYL